MQIKNKSNILHKPVLLVIFILSFSISFSQKTSIDSLINIYNSEKIDSLKSLICLKIGDKVILNSPDSAIYWYEQGRQIAAQCENNSILSANLNGLGRANSDLGEYNKAEEYFLLSIKLCEEMHDSAGISSCYNNLGIIEDILGNYDKALNYYQKALVIAEKHGEEERMSACYTNIGVIYINIESYDNALEYFNKALKIYEKLKNQFGISACFGNIGIIYSEQNNHSKAFEYFNKSLKIAIEMDDKYGISTCYMFIGNVYLDSEDYEKSIENYNKSLEIKKVIGDKKGISILYGNIAEVYNKSGKYSESIEIASKELELAKELGALSIENYAYQHLTESYEKLGNYKTSLEYHKLFTDTRDSLLNVEKNKQLTEMETKYQTEKKQQEIELLNKDKDIQSKEIQKQTILRNSFIIGFGLIFLVALFIYRNFRNKKKANQLLTQKNAEIEQQKEEIESQRDELQTTNQKLETLNSELEKLSIVASETDNSVVITDEKGEIEWVNDGFTRLFEYTKDEFIEKFGTNIKKASKNKDIENAIKECIKERKTVVYITLNQTKSGKTIWTQTTLTPIIKDNSLIKLVAIDSDISKLKEAEEEIKQQKEELEAQSELLMQTNNQLELKNTQITDSIRYAKQIQDAMLPLLSPKFQDKNPKSQSLDFEAFVFFKPKDIVSGDFYWFTKTSEYTFIAVADCTGHGVPGAFMSMIGNILLNEIITQKKIYNLSEILTKLDEGVNFAINKQNNSETSQEDGMEISICRIDTIKNEIEIASTNQSVYIFNGNELTEIEGGLYSIGGSSFSNKTFESHTIKIKENTNIYLLSDGYQDQFGGEDRKKYGSSKLKELLKTANEHSFREQKNIIESEFNSWIGNNKQIDDVTILGININSSI